MHARACRGARIASLPAVRPRRNRYDIVSHAAAEPEGEAEAPQGPAQGEWGSVSMDEEHEDAGMAAAAAAASPNVPTVSSIQEGSPQGGLHVCCIGVHGTHHLSNASGLYFIMAVVVGLSAVGWQTSRLMGEEETRKHGPCTIAWQPAPAVALPCL